MERILVIFLAVLTGLSTYSMEVIDTIERFSLETDQKTEQTCLIGYDTLDRQLCIFSIVQDSICSVYDNNTLIGYLENTKLIPKEFEHTLLKSYNLQCNTTLINDYRSVTLASVAKKTILAAALATSTTAGNAAKTISSTASSQTASFFNWWSKKSTAPEDDWHQLDK